MSGGYFDRSTYAMREIADTIERDIARALQPKPEKVYENYWTIYEKDSFGSYHSYKNYMSFASYEDAESFLLRDTTIVKAEQKYVNRQFFGDGVIFQSTTRYMSDTSDGEQIPVLYSIHHLCDDTIKRHGRQGQNQYGVLVTFHGKDEITIYPEYVKTIKHYEYRKLTEIEAAKAQINASRDAKREVYQTYENQLEYRPKNSVFVQKDCRDFYMSVIPS